MLLLEHLQTVWLIVRFSMKAFTTQMMTKKNAVLVLKPLFASCWHHIYSFHHPILSVQCKKSCLTEMRFLWTLDGISQCVRNGKICQVDEWGYFFSQLRFIHSFSCRHETIWQDKPFKILVLTFQHLKIIFSV